MFKTDAIKREARKQAWKNDSFNPFRKINRAGTNADVEKGNGVVEGQQQKPPPLVNVASGPGYKSPQDGDFNRIQGEKQEESVAQAQETGMTDAKAEEVQPEPGRTSDPDSGSTAIEKDSTRSPVAQPKARRRFLRNPWKKDEEFVGEVDGEEEKPRKQPWYKGKELKHEPFTVRNQIHATILNSWINVLIIAAPVGIALHFAKVDGTIVFVVNFIAIIPLAAMLSFATEEIALHLGETLGGLLNASFGYARTLFSSYSN